MKKLFNDLWNKLKLWWFKKKGYFNPLYINNYITVEPEVYGPLNDVKRGYLKNMLDYLQQELKHIDDIKDLKTKVYIKNICNMLNASIVTASKFELDRSYYKNKYIKFICREPNMGSKQSNLIRYLVFVPNNIYNNVGNN